MKTTKQALAKFGATEANGWVPTSHIHQEATKAGEIPMRLVIYRSERDYGTYAAAKVVSEDDFGASGALLRLAAALEEAGIPVNIDRDKVGNRMFWIETEDAIVGCLDTITEIAAKEGW